MREKPAPLRLLRYQQPGPGPGPVPGPVSMAIVIECGLIRANLAQIVDQKTAWPWLKLFAGSVKSGYIHRQH